MSRIRDEPNQEISRTQPEKANHAQEQAPGQEESTGRLRPGRRADPGSYLREVWLVRQGTSLRLTPRLARTEPPLRG